MTRARIALATALILAVPVAVATVPTASAGTADRTSLTRWSSTAELDAGTSRGVAVANGRLRIAAEPARRVSQRDPYGSGAKRSFDIGRWRSPWVTTGFSAQSLVPSWNVVTQKGTFVRIDVRARSASARGSWDRVAFWAHQVTAMHRHSGPRQADDVARLLTDTIVANDPHRIQQWQLRITLFRPTGTSKTPRVNSLGGVAASYLERSQPVSSTTMSETVELPVPTYSQMVHGHRSDWGSGPGWCSPTSMAMVLDFHGRGPSPKAYAWTGESDGQVDHAARFTWDHAYRGTGNWPFNTAYAGQLRLDAFVTRLHSLRDAEQFIRAGIPVITSVAFSSGQLTGSPLRSTPGHLLVVRGFTADGRVIANDPAAETNGGVRRVYDRAQFERAWLGGSGGVTYVVRPPKMALPRDTPRW